MSVLLRFPKMSHRSGSRRLIVHVLAVASVLCSLVAPALADESTDDLRTERETNRQEAADAAAQLNTLTAFDQELLDAIADLDAQIALQESKISAAERAIADAEASAVRFQAEAATFDVGLMELKVKLRESAIDAYMRPTSSVMSQLNNSNLMQEAIRRSFLDDIAGNTTQLIDELRATEAKHLNASRAALDAAALAEEQRTELAQHLAEIDESLAEQQIIRSEVQARIGDWQDTADEIEQANRDIAEEIRQIEAEEARRVEEEARRAAEAAAEQARREAAEAADDSNAEPDEAADDSDAEPDPIIQPPATSGDFVITHRPVSGIIVSPFGARTHPIFGSIRYHYGLDMDGDTGDPILAAADGVVISARWMNGYGNAVVISHGGGFTTLYAHQSELLVSIGDSVTGGQTIGLVGSTGWSSGPHLHFEVRINGEAVDPAPYLP